LASLAPEPLMPQIVADPLWRPVTACFRLFLGPGIQKSQLFDLDPFLASRASRAGGASREAPATRAASAKPGTGDRAVKPTSQLHAPDKCNYKESLRC
jgi:hypothetical protein